MAVLSPVRSMFSATLLVSLVACASVSAASVDGDRPIDDGQQFSMHVGEQVTLADRATLRYVEVVNDSRCRPDVQCIWAGDAEVRFEWSMGNRNHTFSLHTGKDPKQQTLEDRRLTLVSLAQGEAPDAVLRIERSP